MSYTTIFHWLLARFRPAPPPCVHEPGPVGMGWHQLVRVCRKCGEEL